MSVRKPRVLIVGRSGSVLLGAVDGLRERGYGANASNQFDRVLDDYDPREVDLVLFGGAVPPQTRERLQAGIAAANPQVQFRSGLAGIAPLLVAQVEQFAGGTAPGAQYDAADRAVRVTLEEPAAVSVEALWASFVPPEPVPHAAVVFAGECPAGSQRFTVPGDVPLEGSYAVVRIGARVAVFPIGATPPPPAAATLRTLPAPEPVATHLPWE